MQQKITDAPLAGIQLRDLLPHRPPMILIDELLRLTVDSVTALATVPGDGHFALPEAPSMVPASVYVVECMAQAVAAWDGYWRLSAGRPIGVGLILGVRDFNSSASYIGAGAELKIDADRLMQMDDGIAVFDCVAECTAARQKGRLTVLSVDRLADVEQRSVGIAGMSSQESPP